MTLQTFDLKKQVRAYWTAYADGFGTSPGHRSRWPSCHVVLPVPGPTPIICNGRCGCPRVARSRHFLATSNALLMVSAIARQTVSSAPFPNSRTRFDAGISAKPSASDTTTILGVSAD